MTAVEERAYDKGRRDRAHWAGTDPLARVVTSLIAIEPLYKALAFFAKKVMVRRVITTSVFVNMIIPLALDRSLSVISIGHRQFA